MQKLGYSLQFESVAEYFQSAEMLLAILLEKKFVQLQVLLKYLLLIKLYALEIDGLGNWKGDCSRK
jgi:hypothetical protein